jgi:hypothetical protein
MRVNEDPVKYLHLNHGPLFSRSSTRVITKYLPVGHSCLVHIYSWRLNSYPNNVSERWDQGNYHSLQV